VGIFSPVQQVNSSVGTVASLIWDPSNTSSTTFGPLGSIASGNVLKDVTIINSGSGTLYVGSGSISATSSNGLAIAPGAQLTIQGYSAVGGSTAGRIWGQTSAVGVSTSSITGLTSVDSVI
jgi:hypothetical protein